MTDTERRITPEMIAHLDAAAGKQHSAEGAVMTTLRELIAMYETSARPARVAVSVETDSGDDMTAWQPGDPVYPEPQIRGHCGPCLVAWTADVACCPECGELSTEALRAELATAARILCDVGKAALVVKPGDGQEAAGAVMPENFEGYPNRECGEHRTTGQRAWCHGCSEWCYPDGPCKGCELPQLRAMVTRLAELVDQEEVQTWADPRLTPHFVRKLRVALAPRPAVTP